MDIALLLPFIVLIGAMFLMTRSAKKKQQQAMNMRDQVQPGTGIRTIGGLYAKVKEVGDDTVLLEIAPGVHSHFAKNAIGAVLEEAEYEAMINPQAVSLDGEEPVVPDDASSLTDSTDVSQSDKPNLVKGDSESTEGASPAADASDESAKDDVADDEADAKNPKKNGDDGSK